jgi:hypothetical protein
MTRGKGSRVWTVAADEAHPLMDMTRPDPAHELLYHPGADRLAEQDGQPKARNDKDPFQTLFDYNDQQQNNKGNYPHIKIREDRENPVKQWMGQLRIKKTHQRPI